MAYKLSKEDELDILKETGLDPQQWRIVDTPPIIPGQNPPPLLGEDEISLQYPAHHLPTNMLSARAQSAKPQQGIPVRALWPVQAPGKANSNSAIVSGTAKIARQAQQGVAVANTPVVGVDGSGNTTLAPISKLPTPPKIRMPITQDNMPDGSNFGRVVNTALTSNQPDLSKSGILGKTLVNIADDAGSSRFAVANIDANRRALIDFTQAGHLSKNLDNIGDTSNFARVVASDQTSNRIDFSKALLNKQLDNIPDGSSRVALASSHASGNVAYNFKGAWSSATSYVIADEVTFGNIYWIALAVNSNSQPSISNANWQAVGRIQGDVQIFTSSGTWSKPAAGTFAVITCIGGGGGGASGDAAFNNGSNETGGGGGGAGGFSSQIIPLSVLGATESVTVGGGGVGGAAITQSVTGEFAGNNGSPGGTSSFGNWLRATGGGAGTEGQINGASGTGNVAAGGLSMFPGAGGIGGNANSNSTATAGTNGTNGASARVSSYGGGSGTAGSSGGTSSSNAHPGTNASTDEPAGGGGGGGAGGVSRVAGTLVAGTGGAGGVYGAGGGGGGAAANNGTSGSAKSGAGGNGAPGIVIVSVF